MVYAYRPDILEQLLEHGVRPTGHTPPGLVYDFLSQLYRYELRRLRNRVARRDMAQSDLFRGVVALRRQYPLVSVHPSTWTLPDSPGESPDRPLC